MNCSGCKYEPEWGKYPFVENVGECRWPCPPCLKQLMKPIKKDKLFDCPVYEKKEAETKKDFHWVCNECGESGFTAMLNEGDLVYYSCVACGCNEFHKEEI